MKPPPSPPLPAPLRTTAGVKGEVARAVDEVHRGDARGRRGSLRHWVRRAVGARGSPRHTQGANAALRRARPAPMHLLLLLDGAAFVAIGLVVLAIPSPQPALVRPVDDVALRPFEQTRRLLASQFVGNGLRALALATCDEAALRLAAAARIATIHLVLALNAAQLRSGVWKRPPLLLLGCVQGLLALAYGALLLRR